MKTSFLSSVPFPSCCFAARQWECGLPPELRRQFTVAPPASQLGSASDQVRPARVAVVDPRPRVGVRLGEVPTPSCCRTRAKPRAHTPRRPPSPIKAVASRRAAFPQESPKPSACRASPNPSSPPRSIRSSVDEPPRRTARTWGSHRCRLFASTSTPPPFELAGVPSPPSPASPSLAPPSPVLRLLCCSL